ncbi:MAG TPA: endopeptidase La [Candidatus Limnocylindrales bacterium]|nr:endopeptidase La [Candidatus Limnocylindrales bacterium]
MDDPRTPPAAPSVPATDAAVDAPSGWRIPLVPLRDDLVFPKLIVPLSVGRRTSIAAISTAMDGAKQILLVAQRDPQVDDTGEADLYGMGTVAEINGMRQTPAGIQMLVAGVQRAKILRFTQFKPFIEVEIQRVDDQVLPGLELEAHMRSVKSLYEKYVESGAAVAPEVAATVAKTDDPVYLADLVAAAPDQTLEQKQAMLETPNVVDRLRLLALFLTKQIEILELKAKIQSEVQSTIGKLQREQILREQLKAIRKELGEDEEGADVQQLRQKIEGAGMPDAVRERALKEVDRMQSIPVASPEVGIIRTYVDWLVALPWGPPPAETWDIKLAARVLDEDHYGVEKIKERILEYMAVRQRSQSLRSPILCFVGPPGVGKTSLGKSIARALGRKFVRLSLGGIHDEAEIRGHRRTYIGAMPGRILQQMKVAGTRSPVFMLDEIDKVGADWRGDPSSALLEVLDPEQNGTFSDHYLEVPYDLSQVLFITTANVVDTIIAPLRDRMEIIRLPGYTEEEKLRIAEQFLKPRQLREHGLTLENLDLPEATLRALIREYTHEAGVRNLDREIANICRKIPRRIAEGETEKVVVQAEDLVSYLGPSRYEFGVAELEDQIGAATGVAVNEYGGDVMTVEAIAMEGQGEFALTGQIGKVMEESARAAVSYARAHAIELGVKPEFFRDHFFHIHVPAGAIPKDGPSAGITMATAVISVLTERPVRRDVAMTGEITLRGKVLPIGGLKEKLLAAHRAGITTFILPEKNRKDLHEVPEEVKQGLELVFVKHVGEVLQKALQPPSRPAPAGQPLGFRRPIAGPTGTVN